MNTPGLLTEDDWRTIKAICDRAGLRLTATLAPPVRDDPHAPMPSDLFFTEIVIRPRNDRKAPSPPHGQ